MSKKTVFIAAVAGLFIHHAFFYYGHFGGDDMTYAQMAHALYAGEPDYGHPFTYRILPLLLLGLSYELFGINDWASALPAIGCTTIILVLFYRVVGRASVWLFLLMISCLLSMKWNLFYSDKIMVDVFVSAGIFSAWVAYLKHWRAEAWGRPVRLGILAAVALFLAFCSKGTLILAVPLFLAYCVVDLIRGRPTFWLVMGATLMILLGVYFAVYHSITGSALSRFAAIEAHHYLNPCSYDILPREVLIERLTSGYLQLLKHSGMLVHGVFAILTLTLLAWKKTLQRSAIFYPVTALICLISVNFMTISTDSYNPVCLDPRHILLFSPILSVCTTYSLLVLCKSFDIRTEGWQFKLAIAAICCALAYPSIKLAIYNRELEYAMVKERFQRVIKEFPRSSTIYGSEVTKMYSRYTAEFEEGKIGLTFLNIEQLPHCGLTDDAEHSYLLRSWYTDWHSEISDLTFDTTLANHGIERYDSDIEVAGLILHRLRCSEASTDN